LTATAAFIAVVQFAVPALVAAFGPAVVAGVTALGAVSGLVWYRVRPGLASMCHLFSAAHALVFVAVWAFLWGQPASGAMVRPPAAAPWAILTLPITAWIDDWAAPELVYGAALAASVLLGRRWVIRRFDDLAGRIPSRPSAPGQQPRPLRSPSRTAAGRPAPHSPRGGGARSHGRVALAPVGQAAATVTRRFSHKRKRRCQGSGVIACASGMTPGVDRQPQRLSGVSIPQHARRRCTESMVISVLAVIIMDQMKRIIRRSLFRHSEPFAVLA
jgi:hypothetical protein